MRSVETKPCSVTMARLTHIKLYSVFTIIILITAADCKPAPDLLSALKGNAGGNHWGLNPEAFQENLKIHTNEFDEVMR